MRAILKTNQGTFDAEIINRRRLGNYVCQFEAGVLGSHVTELTVKVGDAVVETRKLDHWIPAGDKLVFEVMGYDL